MVIANRHAPPGMDQDRYERRMATGVDHFAAIVPEDVGILNRLARDPGTPSGTTRHPPAPSKRVSPVHQAHRPQPAGPTCTMKPRRRTIFRANG